MALVLTPELVAKAHRAVIDLGPSPGVTYLQEEDYGRWIDQVLRAWEQEAGFWVFAYGSLIWKPEFVPVEERSHTLPGGIAPSPSSSPAGEARLSVPA